MPASPPALSDHCEVIAEAGVNHNGDGETALALVEAAAAAGADVVKFQTFDPEELTTASAAQADYQKASAPADGQRAMLRSLVLAPEALRRAARRCDDLSTEFLSTPFDLAAARFLVDELGMARIKVGSGELTNLPFLLALARLGRPLLLSTGMAMMAEVERALGVVAFGRLAGSDAPSLAAFKAAYAAPEAKAVLAETVVMQCTTQYPAPPQHANLRVMDAYAALGVRPGYSDHTPGIVTALAAAARGAVVIEKHLTLSRNMPGPDHWASLEPEAFAALVAGVREVGAALGSDVKTPGPAEAPNRAVARRSLVAARAIAEGEPFSEANLTAKRPGTGVEPGRLWDLLGQPANRAYAADELIEP